MTQDGELSDLELAYHLADLASLVALEYFERGVGHRLKLDGSPVTDADLATEKAMIEVLREHRPNDGIVSEESGTVVVGSRRWLLDPIDGTTAFMARSHHWGTHIALETDGAITLGMITRPTRRARWWAVAGEGAFRSREDKPTMRHDRLRVSATAELGGAGVGVFGPRSSQAPALLEAAGARVHRNGSLMTELLEGRLDAVVADNCGSVWDHAPAVLLVPEAGGHFRDPQGGTRPDRQGGLYTNGLLDDDLLAALVPIWGEP